MPGRLVMDQHAVQSPDGLKKDSNSLAAHTNGSHHSPPPDRLHHSDFAQHDLTDSKFIRDGPKSASALLNGSHQAQLDKGKGAPPAMAVQDQQPPQLDDFSDSYVAIKVLYPRVAQQCYSDLGEQIDFLAEAAPAQQPPIINGALNRPGQHAGNEATAIALEKKQRWMAWAQEQKDRFIKLSVLTDWARNMPQMNRLIQLRMWLQQQDAAGSAMADAIVQLKQNTINAKLPNPNIQGALELLSTSKAPWMPDVS